MYKFVEILYIMGGTPVYRKRIAIIGGGVAGITTAWLLSRRHDVTLFERNDYPGGHTHTIDVETPEGPVGIDTGFVVFNRRNYPHLTRLFEHLDIRTQETDMSFSASINQGRVEYAGSNLNTLFARRRNLVNPVYWSMLRDILRFNADGKRALALELDESLTLGDFLHRQGYGWRLAEHYLLPMAAAIWSCPAEQMREFPAISFLSFFSNHGLLDIADRPRWQTVRGGAARYVDAMLAGLDEHLRLASPASCIRRDDSGVWVHGKGSHAERFDEAVLACHADEALRLIERPSRTEGAILSRFRYQQNRAILHGDTGQMPRSRRVWSSWNYLAETRRDAVERVSVTYWMNRLQRLDTDRPFFVTLNPLRDPDHRQVIADMIYHHPVFDTEALAAQQRLSEIQGRDRLWFCGSYTGYGFHEDALRSALNVARAFGVTAPWEPGIERSTTMACDRSPREAALA